MYTKGNDKEQIYVQANRDDNAPEEFKIRRNPTKYYWEIQIQGWYPHGSQYTAANGLAWHALGERKESIPIPMLTTHIPPSSGRSPPGGGAGSSTAIPSTSVAAAASSMPSGISSVSNPLAAALAALAGTKVPASTSGVVTVTNPLKRGGRRRLRKYKNTKRSKTARKYTHKRTRRHR